MTFSESHDSPTKACHTNRLMIHDFLHIELFVIKINVYFLSLHFMLSLQSLSKEMIIITFFFGKMFCSWYNFCHQEDKENYNNNIFRYNSLENCTRDNIKEHTIIQNSPITLAHVRVHWFSFFKVSLLSKLHCVFSFLLNFCFIFLQNL